MLFVTGSSHAVFCGKEKDIVGSFSLSANSYKPSVIAM
jgi:hypothetical protein